MKYLLVIFLFVGSVQAQIPDFRLLFEQNGVDASGNAFPGHHTGDSIYSTTHVEGSYSYAPAYNDNWESKGAFNLDDRIFSISCNIRSLFASGEHSFFTNKQNSGSAGIDLRWDWVNQRLRGRSSNGSLTNDFATASSILSNSTWYHVVAIFDGQYVRIYLNGTKLTMADSTIRSDWTVNDTISIGTTTDGNGLNFQDGYIDSYHFYDYEVTSAQASSLYTNRSSSTFQLGGSPPAYNPPQFRPHVNGIEKKPYVNSVLKYMKYGITGGPLITQVTGGYDSTYSLSCAQKFAIPEDVNNGDYVGTWRKTWTYMNTGNITFSLLNTHNGAFTIVQNSANSALIQILDASKIDGKILMQDTLINLVVRTYELGGGYEDDTAKIWVKENAFCKFYDFAGAGTGTRVNPYNDMDDVAFSTGYGYFLKRGSVVYGESTVMTPHIATSANPTIFGAYDAGVNPVFDGTGAGASSQCFYFGNESSLTTGRVEYLDMYDIDIKDYTWVAIEAYSESRNMGFYNMYLHNNDKNGAQSQFVISTNSYTDTLNVDPFELINCQFDTCDFNYLGEPSHIKAGTSPLTITNCRFGISNDAGLRLADGSNGAYVKHSYFDVGHQSTHSYGHYNIQCRMHNSTFEDCRFLNGSKGIVMASASGANYMQPDDITIKNCYFYSQGTAAIHVQPPADSYNKSVAHVYEDNLIITKSAGIIFRDNSNLTIRRNTIRNTGSAATFGISGSSETSATVGIYYNVIYGFATDEIRVPASTSLTVYNNTVDGTITLTGSTSPLVRNNIYLTSTTNTSNNLSFYDIIESLYFTNYSGHDYSLKYTAVDAIDQGYDLSLTPDIRGTVVPQGTAEDIGAYEFIP